MPRYRLLTTAQIDGAVREPGYIFTLADGVRPPHRSHVADSGGAHAADGLSTPRLRDVALAVEIDEEHEQRLADLHARHAEERAALDRSTERAELDAKHAHELRELAAEGARRDLERRQAAEQADLEARHQAEARGLEQRETDRVVVVSDTDAAALRERHDAEARAIAQRHAQEREKLAASAPGAADEPDSFASVADPDWREPAAAGPETGPATAAGVHAAATVPEADKHDPT